MPVPEPGEPFGDSGIDPDVDLRDARRRAEPIRREWDILLAIALGGALGAEARYGLGRLVPHDPGTWPWSTLLINVLGSAVLATLMGVLGELDAPPRLARPFVGVGVCGGFTTFSTFSVDEFQLFHAGRVLIGLAYIVASVLVCVAGVVLAGTPARTVTRALLRRRTTGSEA